MFGATDVLSEQLHLGQALAGSASWRSARTCRKSRSRRGGMSGHLDVAVSNISGGIAIQTVVLAALDGVRRGSGALLTGVARVCYVARVEQHHGSAQQPPP